jgi:GNAT superfamily N-acetyltransferase
MNFRLVDFETHMLPEAAVLLAARHRRLRAAQPLLPRAFSDPDGALAALECLSRNSRWNGAALVQNGRLCGYLVGRMETDELRGRTAWVPPAGHALKSDVSTELYRDLYARAAEVWLEGGCFCHHVLSPACLQAELATWFDTGFGKEQAYAVRALSRADAAVPPQAPDGIGIRRAEPADAGALREVAHLIARHQTGAPVWAAMTPEYLTGLSDGYEEASSDETATFFLALRDGRILAFQGYYRAVPAAEELFTPDDCVELSVAATLPEERGRGLMRLLTAHGFAAAYAAGYRACVADWRTTNLRASRFWPACGFQPTAYRLTRRMDSRISWAR